MEDMPEIKFSKHYKKLPPDANGKLATLLDVHKIMLQNQTEWLLKYDTEAQDGSFYELPKQGEYLFLLFELENGCLFTTLRRWMPAKDAYYRSLKGKFLKVVITDVPAQ